MTPDRWRQVQKVFYAALDLPNERRDAFLTEACADDSALRKEVSTLLAADTIEDDLVDGPLLGDGFELPQPETLLNNPNDPPANQQIGPYRLTRLIASGGMGAVYLARHEQGKDHNPVALKLIRYGIHTDALLQRFTQERQLLAKLDHPNIARLLDAAATSNGIPYLVMEYVEGKPIDQYCDEHRLSTDLRLRLFLDVCTAAAYAHQNLIVHCDLKPNNVLVTTDGVPKLLDFGIARVLSTDAADPGDNVTTIPLTLMTPDYASPEQVRGDPMATTTDVYSLGVVLYELLTGHRPYRFKTRLRHEIQDILSHRPPIKPSQAIDQRVESPLSAALSAATVTPETVSANRNATPHRLRSQLTGDLDTIVLKALRPDPAHRYPSVEQFAEDIRRHLDGLPILARKDTFTYRCTRFIKRNKRTVVAGSALVLTLMIGIAATTWQARTANAQRKIAEQQRQLAEQNLLRARDAERRFSAEARRAQAINAFVDTTLGSVDPGIAGGDATMVQVLEKMALRIETEFNDQPELEAPLRHIIGKAYHSLGLFHHAERHLRTSIKIYQSPKASGITTAEELARCQKNLADLLRDKGDYQAAQELYRRALAVFQSDHFDATHRTHESAATMASLAALLYEMGQDQDAEPLCRQAIEMYRRQAQDTYDHQPDLDVADSLHHLATMLQYSADLDEAERMYRRALVIRRRLLREDHPAIADTLHDLASVLVQTGHGAEAEILATDALALRRNALPQRHPGIGATLFLLADIVLDHDDPRTAEFAEDLLIECVEVRRVTVGPNHWLTAEALSALGECLVVLTRFDEAEPLLVNSFARLQDDCGESHDRTQRARRRLVELYNACGKASQAARYQNPTPPLTSER